MTPNPECYWDKTVTSVCIIHYDLIIVFSDCNPGFIIIIIMKAMRLTWYKCKSTARLRYNTRG